MTTMTLAEFYGQQDPAVKVCRGKRRHKFACLVPGKPNDHVQVHRIEGVYWVTELCERDCGRTLEYSAGRNGRPDYSTARYGGWQIGVQLAPKGLGATRDSDFEEMLDVQETAVVEAWKLQAKRDKQARTEPLCPECGVGTIATGKGDTASTCRRCGFHPSPEQLHGLPPAARFREPVTAKAG